MRFMFLNVNYNLINTFIDDFEDKTITIIQKDMTTCFCSSKVSWILKE